MKEREKSRVWMKGKKKCIYEWTDERWMKGWKKGTRNI